MLESCSDDLEHYFLGRLVDDEVVHKSLAVHIAEILAKKGIKIARDKLTHMITHTIAQHAGTHTTIAVQHGVIVATQHTAVATAGTSTAAVVGSIVGTVLIKAFAAHITVILPKILASETFRMLVMAATHKVVYVSATAATANLLAAKAGAATLHAIIGPVAITFVGYKLKRLPNDLGKSIARGVRKDLEGSFGSITQQVLDEMAKDVYDIEKLASAVFDKIITVDGWEKSFEGLDVADPAILALNHEIGRGVGYAKGFRKMTKADETVNVPHESPPACVADLVCVTCDLNRGPLDGNEQLIHANECSSQRKSQEDIIVRCWVCYVDLQEMSDVAKNEHLKGCLDRRSPQVY